MWQELFTYGLIVLFVLHELEEIIFLKPWLVKNASGIKARYPRIGQLAERQMFELGRIGFTLIVVEELIVFCVLLFYSIQADIPTLWVGVFIMLAIHWAVTVAQSIVLRRLIPGTVTAALGVVAAALLFRYVLPTGFDLLCGVGLFVVAMGNLLFMHWLVAKVGRLCHRSKID